MTSLRFLIAIVAVACAWGCSPPGSTQANGATSPTRAFLDQVRIMRVRMTTEDGTRIPALMRARDSSALIDEGAKLAQFQLTLDKLDTANVDPAAVKFMRGVEATLRAYRSVCGDAAEFFRELRDSDAKPSDRGPLSPGVTAALQSSQGDTLAALDAVGAAMGGLDTSGSEVLLAPIVNTLHADRSALSQAHHDENELARAVNETP